VNFKNTVVIMTSNLGAEHLLAGVTPGGELVEGARQEVMSAVRRHFRPEFLNRLSDIVVFSPLTREDLRQIVTLQLAHIGARLQDRRVTLRLGDKALERILKEAYEPQFGARPLKRYLERQVSDQLSRRIIAGELPDNAAVVVEDGTDGLELQVERNAETVS
jgi:ATP-dependent Clp protease ATP-binding subunit ClpB